MLHFFYCLSAQQRNRWHTNFKPVINGDDQREVVETNDVFDSTSILSSYTHAWRKRKRLQLQFGGCSWALPLRPINFVIAESWFPYCKLLSSSNAMNSIWIGSERNRLKLDSCLLSMSYMGEEWNKCIIEWMSRTSGIVCHHWLRLRTSACTKTASVDFSAGKHNDSSDAIARLRNPIFVRLTSNNRKYFGESNKNWHVNVFNKKIDTVIDFGPNDMRHCYYVFVIQLTEFGELIIINLVRDSNVHRYAIAVVICCLWRQFIWIRACVWPFPFYRFIHLAERKTRHVKIKQTNVMKWLAKPSRDFIRSADRWWLSTHTL